MDAKNKARRKKGQRFLGKANAKGYAEASAGAGANPDGVTNKKDYTK